MIQAVILALQILFNLLVWLKQSQQIDAGKDQEIAKAAVAILQETNAAKKVMAEVLAMTDSQVDATLKGLEPK